MAHRIELRFPHSLRGDEARERLDALAEYYRNRHHATSAWHGETLAIEGRYLGIRIDIRVRIEPASIHVDASDPGFLLRSRGTKYLDAKIRRYMSEPIADLPRR